MIDERILLIITSELTGQAEKEDLELLKDWLAESNENSTIYHRYKEAFNNGRYIPRAQNQDEVFDKLSQRLNLGGINNRDKDLTHKRSLADLSLGILKYAAALAFFVVAGIFIVHYSSFWGTDSENVTSQELIVKSNPRGIKSQITLPDGTRVKLNSESSIEYYADFTGDRHVRLVGEAFFEVAKDSLHPFLVQSNNLTVKVHGTSFNIKAYPFEQSSEIALVSGKISVEQDLVGETGEIKYLRPGEMLQYNSKTSNISISKFDYDLAVGWKDGTLNFHEVEFSSVVKMLERWYGVTITIDSSANMRGKYTGFYQDETLKAVLEGLSFAYEFEYTIEGKKVFIK